MSGRLAGKVALVTGAARGQGRSHALRLAGEGADIIAVDICQDIDTNHYPLSTPDDLAETAALIEKLDRRVITRQADVRDRSALADAVNAGVAELGHLDVVVCNAGICPLGADVPPQGFLDAVSVDLVGVINTVDVALRHLKAGASIIGTSSVQSDSPSPNLIPYAATKSGIASMSASLAQMLGPRGIRVNSVAPGPIWTPLIPASMPQEMVESFGKDSPLGRPGQPAEVAPAYVLLASDDGSYMSGARVAVTGGSPIL